jgi:hypothetical protein
MTSDWNQVRDRDAEGVAVAGSTVAGHIGAAGEGDHPDALQQMVEEHRGRLHATGRQQDLYIHSHVRLGTKTRLYGAAFTVSCVRMQRKNPKICAAF